MSFYTGDVVLKDLNLKAEALNSLKLPVTVKAGFVGTITLKVAIWFSLDLNFDLFLNYISLVLSEDISGWVSMCGCLGK